MLANYFQENNYVLILEICFLILKTYFQILENEFQISNIANYFPQWPTFNAKKDINPHFLI